MAFGLQIVDLNRLSFSLGTAVTVKDTNLWEQIEGNGKIKVFTNFTLNDIEGRDILVTMIPSGQTYVGSFLFGATMYYVVATANVQNNKTYTNLVFQTSAPAKQSTQSISKV